MVRTSLYFASRGLGHNVIQVTSPDVGDGKTVSQVNGAVSNVGHAVVGLYGSLVINADGSYSYTVDNANAAVEAANTPMYRRPFAMKELMLRASIAVMKSRPT